jgi:predicted AAA+ superfamily ATPase
LLVLDEIHKMPAWKSRLKGVIDAKPPAQSLLVTGIAAPLKATVAPPLGSWFN